MADWNSDKKVLTIKLVYYGPALSGKTTNVVSLHDLLQPELKGDMQILETKNDRTLFFDLLPLGIRSPDGTLIKLKIYTVPGQVVHNSTRKAVLSRCDGIIFVADSQITQSENNAESFNNLIQNAKLVGIDIDRIPLIIQFNKRDLNEITTKEELEKRWENCPWPLTYASALNQEGVVESLILLLHKVYEFIDSDSQGFSRHGLGKEQFVEHIISGNIKC
ncbi:ATP/GTP-binding protein [Aliikangiella sp. G2MR2-5]|uniref:GTP-binding protein n=1 Tax=Aliikangiella sp. G2MR2-5 TaxID=2788943 RepID=UPI0018A920F9|nr:GTPase domain-containing protein [Aliikangiella sp. G2MR2-5]